MRIHNSSEFVRYVVDGLSKSSLARVFGMSRYDVGDLLENVTPDGERGGHPIYKIGRVAPLLLGYADSIDGEKQAHLDPSKMRPSERKDHWNAVKAEQEALAVMGDLWPTEKIVDMLGQAYKQFKLGVQLFSDTLDRQTELSVQQRELLTELSDELLLNIKERLIDEVDEPHGDISRLEGDIR